MKSGLPLSALLSHALVAFTIEFDNEFEHQVPHRTTNHGSTAGAPHAPWLVSMVMWSNFMRFVGEEGTTIRELQRQLQMSNKSTAAWLTRLSKWWGYLSVEPEVAANPSKPAHTDAIVRPTLGGRKAIEVWQTLEDVIERRWRKRFGEDVIDHLREALSTILSQIDVELPHGLHILGYGLFSSLPEETRNRSGLALPPALSLASLLSGVLLWFAVEFERDSQVSLAISANVLRLLNGDAVLVKDLPRLASVSQEAVATSLSFLVKQGYAEMKSQAGGSRSKGILLAAKGRTARDTYRELVWAIEHSWQARFGQKAVSTLRELLERLTDKPDAEQSLLFKGLEPYPDGWRASMPRMEQLPHYPMVLHRGGFPDGS